MKSHRNQFWLLSNNKQGKSEGFDSWDRPSNLTQGKLNGHLQNYFATLGIVRNTTVSNGSNAKAHLRFSTGHHPFP